MENPIKLVLISDNLNTIKKIFYPLNHKIPLLQNKAENYLKKTSLNFTKNYQRLSEEEKFKEDLWHGERKGRNLFLCLTKKNFPKNFAFEFLKKFSVLLSEFSDDLNSDELLLLVSELFEAFEKKIMKKKSLKIFVDEKIFGEGVIMKKKEEEIKKICKKKDFWNFFKGNFFIILICLSIILLVVIVPIVES